MSIRIKYNCYLITLISPSSLVKVFELNLKALHSYSDHMLNIMQNNSPLYQILKPLQDQTATSMDNTEDALRGVKCL